MVPPLGQHSFSAAYCMQCLGPCRQSGAGVEALAASYGREIEEEDKRSHPERAPAPQREEHIVTQEELLARAEREAGRHVGQLAGSCFCNMCVLLEAVHDLRAQLAAVTAELDKIRALFPWDRGREGLPDVPVLQEAYDTLRASEVTATERVRELTQCEGDGDPCGECQGCLKSAVSALRAIQKGILKANEQAEARVLEVQREQHVLATNWQSLRDDMIAAHARALGAAGEREGELQGQVANAGMRADQWREQWKVAGEREKVLREWISEQHDESHDEHPTIDCTVCQILAPAADRGAS